jgi:hypothetical protein
MWEDGVVSKVLSRKIEMLIREERNYGNAERRNCSHHKAEPVACISRCSTRQQLVQNAIQATRHFKFLARIRNTGTPFSSSPRNNKDNELTKFFAGD